MNLFFFSVYSACRNQFRGNLTDPRFSMIRYALPFYAVETRVSRIHSFGAIGANRYNIPWVKK
jgi:hypothetical protein